MALIFYCHFLIVKQVDILMMKAVILGGLVFFSISCTKKLEVKPDSIEEQLEIKGTISPQSGLEVIIKHTRAPYEWIPLPLDSAFMVENAKVKIYHRDTLLDDCRYMGESFYKSQNPERILSGQEYTVKVEAKGYPPAHVENIFVPESPPDVREFRLTPYPDNAKKNLRDTLYFEVKNKPELITYRIDIRYDNIPLNEKISYIYHFSEIFDACEGIYYFTNKCFSEPWIPRKYEYLYQLPEDRAPYFHISIIESAVLDYIETGYFYGESGFVEPPLYQGNVEGGFGYIVGENKVIIPVE